MKKWIIPFLLFISCAAPKQESLTIACAANLENGIDSLAKAFTDKEGIDVEVVAGASGILATQIRSGAPYDLYISADKSFTDELNEQGFASSSELFLSSQLVCVNHTNYKGNSIEDLILNEETKKIGIADPEVAPFGKAAKNYLVETGVWDKIESKVVYAESVSHLNWYTESYSVDVAFTSLSFIEQKEFAYNFIEIGDHSGAAVNQYLVRIVRDGQPEKELKKLHEFLYSEEANQILAYFGYK